jgi:hypothetical protein
MKNLFLISLLFITIITKGQITLEQDYNNVPLVSFVRLSLTDNKWAVIDTNSITLYNLNHSLYTTIPIVGAPVYPSDIMYISKGLFDTDTTTIEYMVDNVTDTLGWNVKIYREDGALLFSEPGFSTESAGSIYSIPIRPIDWNAIVMTINGPKMILSHLSSGNIDGFKIYSLPGSYYPNGISQNMTENRMQLSNSYPNPTNSTTKIDYALPNGIAKGEIVFYDTQGKEVKRFNVDRTFNSLLISTEDLQSGIYYYNLQTTQGISEAKKLVTIK